MRPFDRHRATVLGWFPVVLDSARTRGLTESAARLTAAEGRLREGRLTAVVCGEFKRGKSTLLNALLEEPEPFLFPRDTMFATSIVSTVTYGPVERVVATLDVGGGRVEQREITRAEIADYVTESANPHNEKKARLIAIEVPNPALESGLTLVDTPGVGGVYAEHTAVTLGFLPTADAIVFVTDATQPLAESELDFLRSAAASVKVTDDENGLLAVLTKIDLGDYASLLENTRVKLAEITGRPLSTVEVTPVSAQAKLDHLGSGDPEDLELSNFPALEDRIWGALSRRRTALLLGGALTELDASAAALLDPLHAEQRALAEETPAKVAAMVADAERREAEFTRLGTDDASWRAELGQQLADCKRDLRSAGRRQIEAIWADVNTDYVYRDEYLDDPEKLVKKVTDRAVLVVGELNALAARRVARIQRDLADTSGLSIERRRFGDLPAPPVPHLEVSGELEEATGGGAMRPIRDTLFGGGLGATIGGIVGSFFGPVGTAVGSWIGGMVGAGTGYQSAAVSIKKQNRKARRQSIKTEIGPLQATQHHHVEDAVDRLMSEFRRSITAELRSRVAEARESAKDEAARLRRAKEQTQKESDQRAAELKREIAPLARLRSDIEAMARRIAEPEPPRARPTPGPVPPQPAAPTSAAEDWADE